jgi:hypothetical protein
MTEFDAHRFLAKCGRWWIGRRSMHEDDIIRRVKLSCLILMLQAVNPIGIELPKLVFSPQPDITSWFYVRIFVVVFSFLEFGLSFWLLMRIRRACQVLGKSF